MIGWPTPTPDEVLQRLEQASQDRQHQLDIVQQILGAVWQDGLVHGIQKAEQGLQAANPYEGSGTRG